MKKSATYLSGLMLMDDILTESFHPIYRSSFEAISRICKMGRGTLVSGHVSHLSMPETG